MRRAELERAIDAAIHGEIDVPPHVPGLLIEALDEHDGDSDIENIDEREQDWGVCVPEYGGNQAEPPINWRGTFKEGWGA